MSRRSGGRHTRTGADIRSQADIQRAYEEHLNTVYRVCYGFFGNAHDAEDATQETFIRLIRHDEPFREPEHEKAWLIRVASNVCKDMLKSAEVSKRSDLALEFADGEGAESGPGAVSKAASATGVAGVIDARQVTAGGESGTKALVTGSTQLARSPEEQIDATLEVVLSLPERLKDVVYLYYYEGYSTAEVAEILQRPASTVRGLLAEARDTLRSMLGGDWA